VKTHDAAGLLGAKQVAGSEVSSKGLAKKLTAAVTGHGADAATDEGPTPLPAFRRTGFLAVSKRDLMLVKMKSGLLTMKLSDTVIAQAPRKQISWIEWDGGKMMSRLEIGFENGVVWKFEVTKASKSAAESIVRALGRKDLVD
jgi:hypothetical protein